MRTHEVLSLSMAHVTIYTRPFCGYCARALALLGEKGADFTEVEAAFEENDSEPSPPELHRVRTADGKSFAGTWDEIVVKMRNTLSDPSEPIGAFMRRAAQRVRKLTGCDLPHHDAEAFLRESARIGLLQIED